jgi:transposase
METGLRASLSMDYKPLPLHCSILLPNSILMSLIFCHVLRFITNNFAIEAEKIALIYKKRWQIELLFKQLKQNFPLKYFPGDNQNAIEIQIWVAMLANLLLMLVKSRVKRPWSFSNTVSVIRQQLMSYINIYRFLEDPEGSWRQVIKENTLKYQNSLFPEMQGACF